MISHQHQQHEHEQSQQREPSRRQDLDTRVETRVGTRDGVGAGDHDQPYRFGIFGKPRASAPYPFNTRQYGRLLMLRGRVQDGLLGADDVAA
jgi:hypothetical protein